MTNLEAQQPTNDNETLDFGKKKKKPKVKNADKQEQSTSQTAAADKENVTEAGGIEDFGKKRRKPRVKFIEDQPEVVDVDDSNQDPNKKNEDQMLAESDSGSVWQGSERDYTYDELLTRALNIMRDKNPDFEKDEKSKFVINPPQLSRIGTRKTSFTNFAEICSLLHRQEKHLLNFLLVELGTTGTLDKQKQLTIKGRFQQNQIQNVLRRYIKDYVMCQTCRSPETNIVKEDRLFYLKCKTCGATCSVASIKSGYQAQVGKRAAIRAKAT